MITIGMLYIKDEYHFIREGNSLEEQTCKLFDLMIIDLIITILSVKNYEYSIL